ncbi:MAG: hypothetical protein ABIH42_03255, partial [Planctomycetota bacterium]
IRASIFLATYELLKALIVNQPKDFFSAPQKDRYKQEVLDLYTKDQFQASCLWFMKQNAISQDDIAEIDKIRKHRNDIAHELPMYLIDSNFQVNIGLFESIKTLITTIDRWWSRNIVIPLDPNYDGQDLSLIKDKDIYSGNMMFMDIISKIIEGKENELLNLYDYFVDKWNYDV